MARALTQLELLQELAPVAEENVNRHLKIARDWNPHDYIPWDEARTTRRWAARTTTPSSRSSARSPRPQ